MKKNRRSPIRSYGWRRFLFVMRITAFLVLAGLFQVSASIYSKETKLDVNASKVSITKVLKMIEEQSEFHFLYRSDHLKDIMVEEINVKDARLEEILDKVIVSQGFSYEIDDRTVVIKKAEVNQKQDLQQQKRTIRGTVKDEKGQPLPGTSVMVPGTSIGQITDPDGNYTLEVPADAKTLEFSFVGMDKQQVSITGKSVIDVILKESLSGLDEVVVVGYGTQKKVNLTGAVDVVTQEKLKNRPSANIGALLQGLSPNLTITTGRFGGEPGADMVFNIRGTGTLSGATSPLILVDGVEMNINNLDPDVIESVSVLKDAAASAIYGSRAPYGVILITTKRGTKNKGVSVSYTNNTAFASPTFLPEWQSSLAYVTAYNQALRNTGLPDKFKEPQIDRIKRYMEGTYTPEYDTIKPPASIWAGRHEGNANYEWFDEYFKDVTVNQKHNINISGGDDKNQFYVSTGYYNQGGSYNWAPESYNRYNVLANFTSQATKWLRLDVSTKYANTKGVHPNILSGDNNRTYVISEMIKFFPTTTMYNVNGTINNPYVNQLMQAGPAKSSENDLFITLGTELEPIKGWKTNINYSYNYTGIVNSWQNNEIWVEIPNGQIVNSGNNPNSYQQTWNSNNYQSLSAMTAYEKTFRGHFLKIMGGYERESKYYSSIGGNKFSLITEDVPSFTTATGTFTLYDGKSHSATEGFFGRFNYNYNEKYLFEVNGRYNGSSRFAPDSRWAFFPSVSAGYNIAKEPFWEPLVQVVNSLKLRGSYGSLGNQSQNVANYAYLATVPISNNLNWIMDNSRPLYSGMPNIISPTLTWETATTINLGTDVHFLNNRLGVSFDWFERRTTDMVGPAMILPATLGTNPPWENNATLSTKGWELVLDWKDRINEDFSYETKFTLADNRTFVTEYLNTAGLINNWYVGKEFGEIWGYETAGLFQTAEEVTSSPDQSYIYSVWRPGDIRYADLNDDGKINSGKATLDDHGDLKIIANTSPRYTVGFISSIQWKNFDFSMFWQGVLKRDLLPSGNLFWGIGTRGDSGGAFYKGGQHEDYWRPADETNMFGPNTDAYFPKPYISFSEPTKNQQTQSRYILNARYIRLQNIQLGYTVPQYISQKIKLQGLKVYVSGENLVTFDNLPAYINPETAFASNRMTGAIYPISRSVSVGINITF